MRSDGSSLHLIAVILLILILLMLLRKPRGIATSTINYTGII